MFTSAVTQFNNETNAGSLRQPRAIVVLETNKLGNQILYSNIEINTTIFGSADTYSVSIPLYGQPAMFDLQYWSETVDLTVKIYIGFPSNPNAYTTKDLELFMVGDVDLMDVDPLNANVRISGRDLTSRLIDTTSISIYPNQTASNIAITLAKKHGLKYEVTPTSGNVGRFFNNFGTNANNLLTKKITEWDLITFLSQQVGFVTFVQADTLFFIPFPSNYKNAYELSYRAPRVKFGSPQYYGTDLRFKRSLTLAKDVVVKVIVPVNPQTGKSFIATASFSKKVNAPGFSAKSQVYTFIRAGLTEAQAKTEADNLARNISLHEIVVSTSRPGDNLLRKNGIIKVVGTNTAYDQIYYVDSVTRNINIETGYSMEITCKNHDTNSKLQL